MNTNSLWALSLSHGLVVQTGCEFIWDLSLTWSNILVKTQTLAEILKLWSFIIKKTDENKFSRQVTLYSLDCITYTVYGQI